VRSIDRKAKRVHIRKQANRPWCIEAIIGSVLRVLYRESPVGNKSILNIASNWR
jgi:hypothetical protein